MKILKSALLVGVCLPKFVGASEFVPRGLEYNSISFISDGDGFAESYLGDNLTPFGDERFQDRLVIRTRDGDSQIHVSNSVVGTPEIFAVDKTRRLIAVVESRGQRSETSRVLGDLKLGNRLAVLTQADAAWQRVQRELDFVPNSVDINPSATRIAVGGQKDNSGYLQIFKLHSGQWSSANFIEFSQKDSQGRPPHVSLVQWSPTKDEIAVHLYRQNTVRFFQGLDEDLKPWGKAVSVGSDPFVGRYVLGGSHYVTANWGRDFTAKSIYDRLPKEASSISLIRLGGESAEHEVVQVVDVARSPEGIAVSNDGTRLAFSSMQDSLYSLKSCDYESTSVITVFDISPSSGYLQEIGRRAFKGILPEGLSFDLSGDFVLASVFQVEDKLQGRGRINIFSVDPRSVEVIEKVGELKAPHGIHHVIVR